MAQISVELRDLSTGVRVGATLLPAGAALAEVKAALPSCGPEQPGQGGALVRCGDGTSIGIATSGALSLRVHHRQE